MHNYCLHLAGYISVAIVIGPVNNECSLTVVARWIGSCTRYLTTTVVNGRRCRDRRRALTRDCR
jgi:hypothetical protein